MSFHRWIAGAFLLFLMLTALFVNALVFSARSFQHNFAQVSGTGVVSMEEIRSVSRDVAALEAKAAPNEIKIAGLENQIADADARIELLSKRVTDSTTKLLAALPPVETDLNITPNPADTDLTGIGVRVQRLEQAGGAASRPDVAALRKELDQILTWNEEITTLATGKTGVQSEARLVQTLLNEDKARIVQQKARYGDNFDRIKAEVDALAYTSPWGLGATLAQVHPTFLSVLLVVSMGALGAILFLFPAYVANRPGMEITFVTIIVRMAFGMVTAFAFFIVANSAIAAFGMAGQESGPSQSLNPFTIAGLGIIAGVMADDIAKWIHERGVYLFSSGGKGAQSALRDLVDADDGADGGGGLINPHGGPHDPV